MTRYRSFLVRWWELQSGERRIEVEHLQSGERTVVATTAAMAGWLEARGSGDTRREARAAPPSDLDKEAGAARRSGESGQ